MVIKSQQQQQQLCVHEALLERNSDWWRTANCQQPFCLFSSLYLHCRVMLCQLQPSTHPITDTPTHTHTHTHTHTNTHTHTRTAMHTHNQTLRSPLAGQLACLVVLWVVEDSLASRPTNSNKSPWKTTTLFIVSVCVLVHPSAANTTESPKALNVVPESCRVYKTSPSK